MKSLITLAGGCFWCIEAVFENVNGVLAVESGYCNGSSLSPTYQEVCTGKSGYAEAVRIYFDSDHISLETLLDIFFAVHDPTTKDQQGNDVGSQYRSGIYTTTSDQLVLVQRYVEQLAQQFSEKITTEIDLEKNYHRAEDYHQHYFANNPFQGYCKSVVSPKIKKLQKSFAQHLKRG